MEDSILINFERILKTLLKKWWVFIIIFALSVILGICLNEESASYTAEGKILVYQKSGEEIGNIMDNASRLQATYDTLQLIKTGIFMEKVQNELSFEVKLSELRECVTTEQISPSRTIIIKVSRAQEEEAQEILCTLQECAKGFVYETLPDVEMKILENENTIQVKKEHLNAYGGIKIGVLVGMALCILTALAIVALYLLNDSIRYKEDISRYLDLPVIAEISEGGRK